MDQRAGSRYRYPSLNVSIHLKMKIFCRIICIAVWVITAVSSHADPVTIKIGASLPLSGRLAFAGEDVQRGIELAAEDFKSESVNFELIFDDNQQEGKQAAASAHKLIDINKVDALISMWDMSDVIAPLTERAKIPHLAIRWNPQIAEDYAYTFTAESTYQSYIKSLLELLNSMQIKSIGLLVEEGQGWVLAGDYLQKSAPSYGIEVFRAEQFNPGEIDFRSVVLRSLQRKPEMLVLLSNPPYTQQLIGKIRELSPAQRFTGYFEALQEPALVDQIPFVAQFEVAEWFAAKFKKRFGEGPKARAAQAYDIVRLLAASTSATGNKPTPISIIDVLSNSKAISGAAGTLFLTGKRSIESQCVWKIARGNLFTIYRDEHDKR